LQKPANPGLQPPRFGLLTHPAAYPRRAKDGGSARLKPRIVMPIARYWASM